MQVAADGLKCAPDWYKLRLTGTPPQFIYLNMKEGVFSMAPVMQLNQLSKVLVSVHKLFTVFDRSS
jgi:hypothetical protein